MKIAISGASGYIGSHLASNLSEGNHYLYMIGRSKPDFLSNLNGEFIHADITKSFYSDRCDAEVFIHLAAANEIESNSAKNALLNTTLGTKNCLDFCVHSTITKFMYVSTFQVYGEVEGLLSEANSPKPANDYAISHLFAEQYVKMYSENHGMESLVIRPTNLFGAPISSAIDRWSLVPNCFCKEAVDHQKITLKSSGLQVRDFINIHDLVNVVSEICQQQEFFNSGIMNISSGNTYSIKTIADIVKGIYQEMFKAPCELKVLSSFPEVSNDFTIDRRELVLLNYNFSPHESINEEIIKIFRLLMKPII